MNSAPRLLGLSLVLLLVFVVAAAAAQLWLRRQDERLRQVAVAAKQEQLVTAVALLTRMPGPARDADLTAELGRLLGGEALIGGLPPAPAGSLRVEAALPDGRNVQLGFSAPAEDRIVFLAQRVVLALLLLGLVLMGVVSLLLILRSVRGADSGSRAPWAAGRSELASLQQLARASAAQGAELAHERGERRRAEEDAHLRQILLNRALEEQVRLGRDLHDGLIQSLYAAGLTLESAQTIAERSPAEARARIAQGLELINAGIRDVRGHLTGLAPETLRRDGFADAVRRLTEELRAGRSLELDLRIDDQAVGRLDERQTTEALLIVREAVSNALRHGGAGRITVRLHAGEGAVGLLVQDDGTGFALDRAAGTGHGVGNMHARAQAAGGTMQVDSTPGRGTRIVLTLPFRP